MLVTISVDDKFAMMITVSTISILTLLRNIINLETSILTWKLYSYRCVQLKNYVFKLMVMLSIIIMFPRYVSKLTIS